MRKFSTLMMTLTTTLMLPLAAQAFDNPAQPQAQDQARVCLSSANMGSDGVDRFQAKLAERRAQNAGSEAAPCVAAQVFLHGGSNGTDGVDRFHERMTQHAFGDRAALGQPARVYLSRGNDGTDGVDRLQRRLAGDA